MDPYNHNPFIVSDRREPRNDREAHRELLDTKRDLAILQSIADDLLEWIPQPELRLVK